jgi:hypothetical protein
MYLGGKSEDSEMGDTAKEKTRLWVREGEADDTKIMEYPKNEINF